MKKLNIKLTVCLVSLFISVILLIIGSIFKNNYCLCFGLIFASLSIIAYSYNEFEKLKVQEKLLKEELAQDTTGQFYFEINQNLKAVKKQRKTIIWGGFAFSVLLIVLGIACVI